MKFILYSLNHAPELTGIGKYNGELVQSLAEHGIETVVVSAPPYYPEWQRHKGFKNRWSKEQGKGVTVYRCPLYVPKNVTTIKRLAHLFSFALSSALSLFTLVRLKPDVLFLVQPTLFCAPAALLYCKLTGTTSVMHIQDFEVDAMFGLGLAGRGEGRFKRIAHYIESWLLKRFDIVSSISYSMLGNAHGKGVDKDKLLFFPNWADTHFVTPEVSGNAVRADWGFSSEDKVVLYSGNIGKKQGLEVVLDAAESLAGRGEVKFVIIGNGAYGETLQQMALDRSLANVEFKPLQPWELVPQILAMADVHLVVQKKGAADAVLPSKLTNILSAGGHALVTAEPHTELGILADRFPGIYELVEPEDSVSFTQALTQLLDHDLRQTNEVARDYAVEYLSKDTVLSRFVTDLNTLCGPKAH